jgi:hypothetical protein
MRSFSSGSEAEIKSRLMLEHQTPDFAVRPAFYDNKWGHEALHGKVLAELAGIPNFPMFGFQSFPASRFHVNFPYQCSPDAFCLIHNSSVD